jgi:Domain of unknown function (DUF6456)
MDEPAKQEAAQKAEMAAIIVFLSLGQAEIGAKNKKTFTLKRRGSKSFEVSAASLAYLARKNWVKREGKQLRITDKAPSAGVPQERATEVFELAENGETRTVTRVAVESPIDYLASRKDKNGVAMLGKAEWTAGDRLRSDFTRANMLPGIGMRWGEPIQSCGGAGGGVTQTDAAMAARARVTKALAAVGPEFSGLLIDVCCFLKGLEQVEMERGWPQRSAKLMLRAGLSILARHYVPPAKVAAKTRTWGADDYRPTL